MVTQEQFRTVIALHQLRTAAACLVAVRLPDDAPPEARAACAHARLELEKLDDYLSERVQPLVDWAPRTCLDPDLLRAVLAECDILRHPPEVPEKP
jgi:hypothetical protein